MRTVATMLTHRGWVEVDDRDRVNTALVHVGDCWCGQPAAGLMLDEPGIVSHRCAQCGPEHCRVALDARRCGFGVCEREASSIVDNPDEGPVRVCDLHVVPALRWGVATPETTSVVRLLPVPEVA